MQAAASAVLFDVDDNARRMVGADPAAVLAGATPRLIDEWQLEPTVWNHVRRAVDQRGDPGQFILAGSAAPADDVTRHTGAGRFTRLRMRPLSLYESGRASGEISLRRLLAGAPQRAARSELSIPAVADLVCAGGWPGHVGRPLPGILRAVRGYLDDVRRTDVSRVSGRTRDPVKVGRLLRSLTGVPLPGKGRAGSGRDRGGGGRPLGGVRDPAGRALGGERREEPAQARPTHGAQRPRPAVRARGARPGLLRLGDAGRSGRRPDRRSGTLNPRCQSTVHRQGRPATGS